MNNNHGMSDIESKVKNAYKAEMPNLAYAKNLRRRLIDLAAQPRKRAGFSFSLAGKLAAAGVACVLALGILFVATPQSRLVLGMRQLFSFIPGVGIVEEGLPLRQLDQSAAQTRDGITVSIDRMILSPDLTAFSFQVNGVPASAYPQDVRSSCGETPYLRLPDGSTVEHTGLNAVDTFANEPSYEKDFVLKAVPAEVDSATLVMPCVLGLKEGAAPENWEFPLSFAPVSAELASMPVEEVTAAAESANEAEPKGPYDDLFTLDFDQRVSLPNGDILYGKVYWRTDSEYYNPTMEMESYTDANGNRLATTWADLDPSWNPLEQHNYTPMAIFIPKTDAPGPYTLTAETMLAIIHLDDVSFVLSAGAEPVVGQPLAVNKVFQAGDFSLKLVSVTRTANGYEVVFDNPEEVGCVDLSINGTTGVSGKCGHNYTEIKYTGDVTTGSLNIGIHNVDVRLKGHWEYTWEP